MIPPDLAASAAFSSMLHLLPALAAVALFYRLFWLWTNSRTRSVLLAFVAVEVLAVFQIEILSLFEAYRAGPVMLFWGAAAVAAYLGSINLRRPEPQSLVLTRWEIALIAACAVLLGGTLLTAILAPANTYDALTYHLPRALHWVQNATIAPYPTAIGRQLSMPPLAEILVSQTILLTGGDRLANLVQWVAYATTATGACALIRRAGLSRISGLSSALLFLSLPTAVLQASSAKNDLVLCANLLIALVFLRDAFEDSRWPPLLTGATALALAELTKGTALIFGGILGLAFLAACFRRRGWKRCRFAGGVLIAALIAVNAGYWIRNQRQFGHPLGPRNEGEGYGYVAERFDAGALFSNLVRNAALHLGTPSEAVNQAIERRIVELHERLGLRIDDPATTWPGTWLQIRRFPDNSENEAGDPLHLLLILAALALTPWLSDAASHRGLARLLAGGLATSAVAFCLILKWQPWHARLHLPLFLAGSILMALVAWRRPRATASTALLFSGVALFPLLGNTARPLVGPNSVFEISRDELLFGAGTADAEQLSSDLSRLRARRIGILLGSNDPEYLIWRASKRSSPTMQLIAVETAPPRSRDERSRLRLNYIVSYDRQEPSRAQVWAANRLEIEGRAYDRISRHGAFGLWGLARQQRDRFGIPRPPRRSSAAHPAVD